MNTQDGIKYELDFKGDVIVHRCRIHKKTDDIITFIIDTSTYHGNVSYGGCDSYKIPMIALEPDDSTFGDITQLSFPDYVGWDIFCYQWVRRYVKVCLIRS